MKKVISIITAIVIAVSFMPAMGTGFVDTANAKTKTVKVKKPAKVKWGKCSSREKEITLKWYKAKNAKKYEAQIKRPYKTWNKYKLVKKSAANKKKFTKKNKYKVKSRGKKYQVYKYSSVYTKKITGKRTVKFKGLKTGRVYKVRVRGINGKTKGKFSVVKKIKTRTTKTEGTGDEDVGDDGNYDDQHDTGKDEIDGEPGDKADDLKPDDMDDDNTVLASSMYIYNCGEVRAGRAPTKIRVSVSPKEAKQNVEWKVSGIRSLTTKTYDDTIEISAPKGIGNTSFTLTAKTTDGSGLEDSETIKVVDEYTAAKQKVKEFKVMNYLPIYDFSYPKFTGVDSQSTKKVLDFEQNFRPQVVFLYLKTNGIDPGDLEIVNSTTGKSLGTSNSAGGIYEGINIGFSYYSLADVDYVQPNSFSAELKRGGYLLPVIVRQDSFVEGKNKIQLIDIVRDIYETDPPVYAEVDVNVQSRATAYTNFADMIIKDSKDYVDKTNYFYKKDVATITRNIALYYKLYSAQKYIKHIMEYTPSYKVDGIGGNAGILRLTKSGRSIDNKEGGCENGAIMMCIVAQRMGVDAEYKYISTSEGVHCICNIKNAKNLFGQDEVTFDASPHSTVYSGMTTKKQYDEYIKTIKKVL